VFDFSNLCWSLELAEQLILEAMKKLLAAIGLTLSVFLQGFAQINCPSQLPITLLGNIEYCVGTSGSELSVQESYDTYEWLPTSETSQSVLLPLGSYQLVVTHYTGCTDTLDIEVEQVSNPPQPTVTASDTTEFCEGGSVTLSGPEGYPYYLWNSGSISREITVYETGTFVLSVIDGIGCSSSSNSISVVVNPLPTAIFSPDLEGYGIEFNNLSVNATSYEWNFGDGATSTDFEPTHTYSIDGSVDMYLVASNDCGNDTAFLNLANVNVEEVTPIENLQLYPNPSNGIFNLQFNAYANEKVAISVFDTKGSLLNTFNGMQHVGSNNLMLDCSQFPSGIYLLHISTESSASVERFQLY